MTFIVSTCAICGAALAALVEICYGCDAATRATMPRAGHDSDAAVLTVRDFAALERVARLLPNDPAAHSLLEKLARSQIVHVEAITAEIATLDSRVIFAVDNGQPEARLLVLPARHRTTGGWTMPVTAPRGLALLGRRAGSVVMAARGNGATEQLRLLAIAHQPEAAAAVAAVPVPAGCAGPMPRQAARLPGQGASAAP